MKDTVRLNFEFPRKEYPYLKMMLAKKGVSLKDFAIQLILKEIDEYEDRLLAKTAQERLDEMNDSENISFDDACELAGWDNDEKVQNPVQ